MPLLRSGLAAALWLVYLVEPASTYACASPVCVHDQFLPRAGSVPANIRALAWAPGYNVDQDEESAVSLPSLECTAADGGTRALDFNALPEGRPDRLELREPLTAGERCRLSSGINECPLEWGAPYLEDSVEFEVGESSPLPETLGLIAVAGPKREEIELAANASCSELVPACVIHSSVLLSEAASPWKDALLYETLIDGEPFAAWRRMAVPDELGGLYNGRDADVVYALIGEVPENLLTTRDLDPGEHTISIQARLPGSTVTLQTPPVTINLDCGHIAQVPLARSEVAGSESSCTVAAGVGSSQRRVGAFASLLLVGLLLVTRRRARAAR